MCVCVSEDKRLTENVDFRVTLICGKLRHSHQSVNAAASNELPSMFGRDGLETNSCSARIVGLKTERQKKKSCAGFQTASITAHINRTRNTNMIKFSVIPVITVKRYYISTLRKFTSTHPDPNSSFHQYEKYANKKYKYSRTLSR